MKNNNHKTIEELVTDSIKSGKIIMKPKWYFILKTVLRVLSVIILFFILIYLLNFIGLVTRERGFNILDLSPRGMHAFMVSVPWVIVLLSMFLLIIFYVLVKKYSFVYRKPLVYSFFGIVFFIVFIGFIIHLFDANFRFARFGEGPRVPVLGPMHKYYRGNMENRPNMKKFDRRAPPPNFEKGMRPPNFEKNF